MGACIKGGMEAARAEVGPWRHDSRHDAPGLCGAPTGGTVALRNILATGLGREWLRTGNLFPNRERQVPSPAPDQKSMSSRATAGEAGEACVAVTQSASPTVRWYVWTCCRMPRAT